MIWRLCFLISLLSSVKGFGNYRGKNCPSVLHMKMKERLDGGYSMATSSNKYVDEAIKFAMPELRTIISNIDFDSTIDWGNSELDYNIDESAILRSGVGVNYAIKIDVKPKNVDANLQFNMQCCFTVRYNLTLSTPEEMIDSDCAQITPRTNSTPVNVESVEQRNLDNYKKNSGTAVKMMLMPETNFNSYSETTRGTQITCYTSQGQRVNLLDGSSSSNIYIMPSGPGIPNINGLPSVPSGPGMPNINGLPSIPSEPGMPNINGLPSVPSIPGMPNINSLPSVPSGPGMRHINSSPAGLDSSGISSGRVLNTKRLKQNPHNFNNEGQKYHRTNLKETKISSDNQGNETSAILPSRKLPSLISSIRHNEKESSDQ